MLSLYEGNSIYLSSQLTTVSPANPARLESFGHALKLTWPAMIFQVRASTVVQAVINVETDRHICAAHCDRSLRSRTLGSHDPRPDRSDNCLMSRQRFFR